MTSKWDRTSKEDFNRAASGDQPDRLRGKDDGTQKDDGPPKLVPPQAGLDQGPRPPGGHAPRQSAWDRHQAAQQLKQPAADKTRDGPPRDDPNLTRNFNNRSRG